MNEYSVYKDFINTLSVLFTTFPCLVETTITNFYEIAFSTVICEVVHCSVRWLVSVLVVQLADLLFSRVMCEILKVGYDSV